MRRSILFPTLGLAGLLCACPGVGDKGPGTTPGNQTIRQFGVVSIGLTDDDGDYAVYGAAGLFLPVERSLESLETVVDRCFVNDKPPLFPDATFATLLDAGESIDIRTDNERFLPLARVNFMGGSYGYTAGDFFENLPFPEQEVTASIPGAAFPAFDGATFPALPPAAELTNEDVLITADGSFTWEPYEVDQVVSLIDFQVFSDFENEDEPYVLIECIAADDGKFSFSPGVRQQILDLSPDFEGSVSPPDLTVYRLEVKGESALALGLGDDTQEILRVP